MRQKIHEYLVRESTRLLCHLHIHLGVNFTDILRAAFTRADPKIAKKDSQLKQLFALLGSAGVKAVLKHVDEIDPRSLGIRLKD